MSNSLRFAVVGAGGIGQRHAKAVAALSGATLAAICDIDHDKARALAEQNRAERVSTDLRELLSGGEIDAVSICTDHGSHAMLLDVCAGAKVHAIVEKPLSTKLSEAVRMVETAGQAGIIFGAIFQRRFFPAVQRMKQAVAAGRIGTVTTAECIAHLGRDKAYFDRADWRGTWAGEGGGSLMNQAIHMLDMLQWVVGFPEEIYGRWATLKHGDYINVEDTAVATAAFANGALATIQAITTLNPAYGFRLAVHGTSGDTLGIKEWPELTEATTDLWTLKDEPDPRAAWEIAGESRPGFPEFHRLQLQDFADAIRSGREPAVSGAEGIKALHMLKAVYLSQHRRLPVRLPLTSDDIAELETFDTRPGRSLHDTRIA